MRLELNNIALAFGQNIVQWQNFDTCWCNICALLNTGWS